MREDRAKRKSRLKEEGRWQEYRDATTAMSHLTVAERGLELIALFGPNTQIFGDMRDDSAGNIRQFYFGIVGYVRHCAGRSEVL